MRGLDPKKDFRKTAEEYSHLAAQAGSSPAPAKPVAAPAPVPAEKFDWDALRKPADAKFLGNLASMRGYSLVLIDWLAKLGLVGSYKG